MTLDRMIAALAASGFLAGCGAPTAAPSCPAPAAKSGEVNVYSSRHYDADLVLYERFACETGIRVNLIEAEGDALIERLAQEGPASPADLFVTADAGMLWRAETRGLFRPVTDENILARAPARFRGERNEWIGLSKRARVIVYSKKDGPPPGLAAYRDLARPEFRGMVCARSSANIYNQSLLAAIIANDGPDAAEAWARGVVANFARPPEGNDTSQIEAVAAGVCRLAVVNSYYVARYRDPKDRKKFAIGERVGVLFPDQDGRGTHVNISGAGVARHAPHPENALRLIAFLLSDAVQSEFARANNEYPVVAGVPPSGPVAALGAFKEDPLAVAALGEHQTEAVKTFDRAGWR
jgi:iron(III) transport system substrate-binding protein